MVHENDGPGYGQPDSYAISSMARLNTIDRTVAAAQTMLNAIKKLPIVRFIKQPSFTVPIGSTRVLPVWLSLLS